MVHCVTSSASTGTSVGSKQSKCTWHVRTGSSPLASCPKHRVPSALPSTGAPFASVYWIVMSTTLANEALGAFFRFSVFLTFISFPSAFLCESFSRNKSAKPLVLGRKISPASADASTPSLAHDASLRRLFRSV